VDVDQMWIFKNFKELSENSKSRSFFSEIDSIKTYDFSKHYARIHHDKLSG
jgi:hypothetical protein